MELNYGVIILIIVIIIIAILLISYHNSTSNSNHTAQAAAMKYYIQQMQLNSQSQSQSQQKGRNDTDMRNYPQSHQSHQSHQPQCPSYPPQNIVITKDEDPYSDHIKKQDLYYMMDPLTYPQQRLPRHVLEQYIKYYNENGKYPPFGFATQPYLFDNPVSVGYLMLMPDEMSGNTDYDPRIPTSMPLFMIKSSKNNNRFFYYIIDQRPFNQINAKIPLDMVKVNGIKYNKADFYGIPELFDDDVVEDITIFPGKKFVAKIYKTYFFP
jgi:hypothetical protein